MFWDYLREFRKHAACLSDLLPWATLLDKGIVLCKDEALMATWKLVPHDMAPLSPHEQGALLSRIHHGWKSLGTGWGIWQDVVRHRMPLDRSSTLAYPMANLVHQDHQKTYARQLWTNAIYLTFWHQPLGIGRELLQRLLWPDGSAVLSQEVSNVVTAFHDECLAVTDVIRASARALEPLDDDALMTYLHGVVSDTWHDVVTPDIPMHLDYQLSDADLVTGLQPKLGKHYLGMISVKSFPDRVRANTVADLNRLPFGFRLVTRWLPQDIDAMTKQLTNRQKKQVAKGFGIGDAAFEWLTKRPSRMKNRWVEYQADDTDQARFEMQKDDISFGDLSITVVLAHRNRKILRRQMREVVRVLRVRGLVVTGEWINATGAWLGSIPGLPLDNPRRFRLSSMNSLHLSAWHEPSRGKRVSQYGPTPLLTMTDTCNPYWLSLFSGDVGHTLIAGPTGAGKSVLMKRMASHSLQQPGAQVFWFDVKRSARLFILCMGGLYHDLGRDQFAGQPLRDIDDIHEQAWAYTWIKNLVEASNVIMTVGGEAFTREALRLLSGMPKSQRTLTELQEVMRQRSRYLERHGRQAINPVTGLRDTAERDRDLKEHDAIRKVLEPYTRGGLYGHLFDADHDDIQANPIQGFELEKLLDIPQLLIPAEDYIWHRLYERFTGVPTMVVIDEAGEQLKYAIVREWVDRSARMLREKSVQMLLATQNHLHFTDSVIGPILQTNCLTRLLLPNPNAMDEKVQQSYKALGLSPHEIRDYISGATPKQDVYVTCPEGRRLIHMPLAPVAMAVCGRSDPAMHEEIDRLLAEVGPEEFPQAWLRHVGLDEKGHPCGSSS